MVVFTEGFDWSNLIADLISYGKWFDRSSISIGNTSGNLRFGSGSGNYISDSSRNRYLRMALPSNMAAGVIGLAVRLDTSAGYKMTLIALQDTTSNCQMGIQINDDLTLSVFRASNSNILGTTTFTLTANTWHYIEFKFKVTSSTSSGDVEIYVDNDLKLSVAASSNTQATANAYATHMQLSGSSVPTLSGGGSGVWYIDDIYILDSSGSYNTSRLGPVRVTTLFPSGNGNSSQLLGSDGNSTNNYLLVDENTAPNSDTDYVGSATVGQKDTYAYDDLPATATDVYAINIQSMARKTDTGARDFNPVIRTGSTDYDQSAVSLSAGYLLYRKIVEENPNTTAPFTVSEVNGMEVGFKVNA